MALNEKIFKKFVYVSIIIFGLLLLSLSIYEFYVNTSSPSDENQFTEPPSKYIINKKLIVSVDNITEKLKVIDTLAYGQFLLSISDINLNETKETPQEILESLPDESLIPIKVYDFTNDKTIKYFLNKSYASEDFFINLKSAALVTAIIKDGASDRAGIKVGDIITEINGISFADVQHADLIMRSAKAERTVKYKILRNNDYLEFDVQLAKFGVKFSLLNTFIIGLIFWLFGFFIFSFRFGKTGAGLLGFSFIMFGFNLSSPGIMFYPFDSFFFRLLPVFTFSIGIATYFHSLSFFPFIKQNITNKKFIPIIYYSISIISFLILIILLLKSTKNFSILIYDAFLIFINFLIYNIIFIIFEKSKSTLNKKISFPIKFLIIFYLSIFLAIILLNTALFNYIKDYNFTMFNNVLNSLFILFPITHFYVILKNNLFEIYFKVRKNIKYVIFVYSYRMFSFFLFIGSLWFISKLHFSVPNIKITGNSIEMLNIPVDHELHEFYLKLFIGTVLILYYIFFKKFYKYIQNIIDTKFYRTNYDYKRATTDIANLISKQININELVQEISKELSEILKIKRLGLLIFKNDSKIYSLDFVGFNSTELREFCFASSNHIYNSLLQINKEINVALLPEPIDKIFKNFKFNYLFPIKSKSKVLGFVLLSEKLSESNFGIEDFDFISSISNQLSVAIENSILLENVAEQERIKHELDIARKIQLASLPQTDPQISGLDIVGMSLPALEVGGDFYDYLYYNNDNLTVVVGDVSGKGTSAALYMSKTQGIISTLYEFEQSPRNLLIKTNQLIYKYLEKNYFISAISCNFDTHKKEITLARAGHLPLYYFNSKIKDVEKVTPKGMMLGLKKEKLFERNIEEINFNYNSGDVFVLVTDGITEARNKLLQEYGEDNLIQTIIKNSNKSSVDIKNSILFSLQKFIGDEIQNDDLTLIVIKAI